MCPDRRRRGGLLRQALFAVAFALAPTAPARGQPVTEAEMARACQNWLSLTSARTADWDGGTPPRIVGSWELVSADTLLARSFDLAPAGHLLIAARRELPPIQSYSNRVALDPAEHPAAVAALRGRLLRQVRLLSGGGLSGAPTSACEAEIPARIERSDAVWRLFARPEEEFTRALSGAEVPALREAGPLLTSAWHQRAPYNDLCPPGDGERTTAGCGPIALAQILRFHALPLQGVGGHSYYWNGDQSCGGSVGGGVLSADFSDPYDWPNMPDACAAGCTPAQLSAVAEICYEVGVAAEADYGNCGTMTYLAMLRQATIDAFAYDPESDYELRSLHTAESWFDVLRSEIDASRPVLYAIPWHFVVCDGWRTVGDLNLVHMNWGDGGGSLTAWWEVDHLPSSPSPEGEEFLRGISPPWRVRPDGGGDFPTIQAAFDALPSGAKILLGAGTYLGPGNRDLDPGGKVFHLRPEEEGTGLCVLDCQGSPGSPHRAFHFHSGETAEMRLERLTIRGGFADRGGGILCQAGAAPVCDRLSFEGNVAVDLGGALCALDSSPSLDLCTLMGNSAARGGALAAVRATVSVTRSTLQGNAVSVSGGGIYAAEAARVEAEGILLTFSPAGGAVACSGGGEALFGCSDLFGNEGGDWTSCIAGQEGAGGNLARDPLYCDPEGHDLTLHVFSPCNPVLNPPCGQIGAWPVACGAGSALLVRSDGTGDFPTIQAAIEATLDSTVILLSPGTFTGEGNRDIDPGGKRIAIRSQSLNPAECVIDCQATAVDRHRAFYIHSGEDSLFSLAGLTLRNGYAPHTVSGYQGGAILCLASSPVIRDCVFENNRAFGPVGTGLGGAVYSLGGSPSLDGCAFNNNQAEMGGALHAGDGSAFVTASAFRDNQATERGGAVHCAGASAVAIEGCTFSANQVGGSGGGGALYFAGTELHLGGSVFAGNVAYRGAAVCTESPLTSIERCSFYANSAVSGTGLYIAWTGAAALERCILAAGIFGSAVRCQDSATCLMGCCDVFANEGGDFTGCLAGQGGNDGNFSLDPEFCNAAAGDFHLMETSPCAPASPPGRDCGLIGAWPAGCESSALEVASVESAVLRLSPARPNPFSRETRIDFEVGPPPRTEPGTDAARLRLTVLDVTGRTVRVLADQFLPMKRGRAGRETAAWDGEDEAGHPLAAGIYYCRLALGGEIRTSRLVLIR